MKNIYVHNVIHNIVKTTTGCITLMDFTDTFAKANADAFTSCLTVSRPLLLADLISSAQRTPFDAASVSTSLNH